MSKTTQATVRILISYDYCHFEISKTIQGDDVSNGHQNDLTQKDIDDARKDCQRLADKAVGQYKTAKVEATKSLSNAGERQLLEREVSGIKATKNPETWSPLEKAKVKALEDYNQDWRYDYMDDDDYNL